jgi:hypothetical protein
VLRRATFLPLTTDAAARVGALTILAGAGAAEAAAGACWASLLAGCAVPGRWDLDARLRRLSEATSAYVGTKWWFDAGAPHRRRVAQAQGSIELAITEGDGQEFARAFAGYDHAMASAVVCARRPARSTTR